MHSECGIASDDVPSHPRVPPRPAWVGPDGARATRSSSRDPWPRHFANRRSLRVRSRQTPPSRCRIPAALPRMIFCANDSAWNGGMGCWRCDQHAFLQATATCVEGLPARIQCLPHALLSTSIRREGRLAPPVIACASRGRGRGLECRCPLRHTRVSFNLYVTVVGGHHRVRRISTLQSGPREAHPSQE